MVSYITLRGYRGSVRGGSHQRAWEYLKSQVPDSDLTRRGTRSALADQGIELLRRRIIADYHLSGQLGRDDPNFSLESANKVIDGLDRLIA
jgi:hypothetical protein